MATTVRRIKGNLDVWWSNSQEHGATPKYSIGFVPYAGATNGPQQRRTLVGRDALGSYLGGLEIRDLQKWFRELQNEQTITIPNVMLTEEQSAAFK